MPTLHTILAAWPIWAPIVAVLLASLVTRLTPYPRAAGVVTALRVVLDVLSVLTHRDSPGTWQLPLVQRSAPPPGTAPAAAPEVPPAALVLALLLAPSLAHADAPADPGTLPQIAGPVAPQAQPAPAAAPALRPVAPDLATLPDCITQQAASGALLCITGKAPAPTDTKTFWITWGASVGSTLISAGVGWLTSHYALDPTPIGK